LFQRHCALICLFLVAVTFMASCGDGASAGGPGRTLSIVAGENFWGSIASQLVGDHGRVQSVVSNPNTDPHQYESSNNDARAFARADLVVLNGAGYDDWGRKLLDANPSPSRRVLTVADLLGKKSGDNPHFWYDPQIIGQVADAITNAYKNQDPASAGYFSQRRSAFDDALKPYRARIAAIRQKFPRAPIGSTESIFVYMAHALGLNLVSPEEFMQAVSEGNDPPAASVATFQDQVTQRRIRALVYNVQTSTLITTNMKNLATKSGIPVVGVSETMQPDNTTFQDWQLAQLGRLESALASAGQ
jgi:zinc/manganese transport system substrate-binding protein